MLYPQAVEEVRRPLGAEPAVMSPHVLKLTEVQLTQRELVAVSLYVFPDPPDWKRP